MKQVSQNVRSGKLRVVEVPEPSVRPGHALVRTAASLISAGTERMVVDFAAKSLVGKAQARPDLVRKVMEKARRDGIAATLQSITARLDEPLPLGYAAAGSIVALGAGLEARFQVGQRVAMAGAGFANHAELNLVPENLLAPVPVGVGDEDAAFATLAAIALHGVRNLGSGLGDVVAVIGSGLVGLLAVQLLGAAGCRVIALDPDPTRRALASEIGAEWALDPEDGRLLPAVVAATGGRGADGVLIAAASDSDRPMALAADIARDRAVVSLVGKVGTAFPFADYMKKELSIVLSRSYGPGRYDPDFENRGLKYPVGWVRWTETENLSEALRLMSRGLLQVKPLITHRFPIASATDAYSLVLEGREPHLGVVLTYPAQASAVEAPLVQTSQDGIGGDCVLGFIGAGRFARAVLLPAVSRLTGVHLRTVVAGRGVSAKQAQERFKFDRVSTNPEDVFDDPLIRGVVIATPHGTHANLAARALASGKAVFVEKPLALNRAELDSVIAARNGSGAFFTVGFNRRFAPYAREMRRQLSALPGAKVISIRINAGPPAESVEGGRILGEVCHFVDLARFLAGAPIRAVVASSALAGRAAGSDDVAATLEFADGSVASIVYTGLGDSADAKEVVEVFCAGTVMRIEDFRSLTVVSGGRREESRNRLGQDKGHHDELAAFVAAVRGETSPPIDENELAEVTLATIAVLESLQSGQRVTL